MPNYIVTGEQLTGIADAIRAKSGESGQLVFPGGFVNEINSIPAPFELLEMEIQNDDAITVEPGTVKLMKSFTLGSTDLVKAIHRIVVSGISNPNPSNNGFRVAYFMRVAPSTLRYLDVYLINATTASKTINAGQLILTIYYYK